MIKYWSSILLPLHEGLIVTANGEEVRIIGWKRDSNYMLRVTSKGNGSVSLTSRVVPDVNQAVVITSRDQISVSGEIHIVDVSSVSSCRENAVDKPSKLSVISSPLSINSVWCTISILLEGFSVKEEKLVSTTDRSNVLAIHTPINRDDEGVMLGALSNQRVITGTVDVDVVIVGANSQFSSIWRILHVLNPLSRVIFSGNHIIEIGDSSSDSQSTIVVADSDVTILRTISESSRTLRIRECRKSGGSSSLDFPSCVRNYTLRNRLSFCNAPSLNLIVISWCQHCFWVN